MPKHTRKLLLLAALCWVVPASASQLPVAADVLRFSSWPNPPVRSIDVCNIGRRSEITHAALIKLARHFPCQAVPDLATGLMSAVGSVTSRVERLMAWKESSVASPYRWPYVTVVAFVAVFGLAAKLGPALVLVHSLTERLVP